ncbi:hypothetical protein ABEF95_002939 [Exophiala dermatitidis]
MSNSKIQYQPLQRHRRRSDHVSPTSPSFSRRFFDRPNKPSDGSSPSEVTPRTDDSDSPLRGLPLSSPSYDRFAALPSAPPTTQTFGYDNRSFQRTSDETGRPKFFTSNGSGRPATSDAVDHNHAANRTRLPADASESTSPRPPPVSYMTSPPEYYQRKSLDPSIKPGDNPLSPTFRTHSFDRAAHEDSVPSKGHGGKKSRLNLLNPMSLLARRRASQNQKLEDVNLSIKTLSVPALPDNFDPSIRGKVVHDFSAPRTRRLYSHNDINYTDSPALRSAYSPDPGRAGDATHQRVASVGTPNVPHSPMFKEHFQDDRPSLQPDRTGYLHNISTLGASQSPEDAENVPAFAKRLPSTVPQPGANSTTETAGTKDLPIPPAEPSPAPPTPPPKRTPSPKFDAPPPATLPKHMTSTSSRFSFQIGGADSLAQEKLLEEKHKQHQATKKLSVPNAEDDEDDFANFDFDDDDGLEEKIPGVNADFEDYEFSDVPAGNALEARYAAQSTEHEDMANAAVDSTTVKRPSLQDFHFTPQSMCFSPASTNNASQPTPRDQERFPIGIADARGLNPEDQRELGPKDLPIDHGMVSMFDGLGITTSETRGRRRSQLTSRPQGQVFDDEDLYFDDGEFGDVEALPPGETVDEQIFDDGQGEIRDIPAENARKFELAQKLAGINGEVKPLSTWVGGPDVVEEHGFGQDTQASADLRPASQVSHNQQGHVAGLTETNLAAYHDALALAANEAAANGKFDRKVSFSQTSDESSVSGLGASQQGVISDESRFSNNFSSAIAEDDGFPFDDDLDDDPMIAEANAEVLANDDDGFYGQEFGFYGRALGKGTAEMVNGGYFAERGSSGIKRSHSGKANFQEPSLTPITERSEWSTRNSVVSLQLPGGVPGSAQSLPSPGIAQLLELDSPAYDDDMSFSALMKLRGRAFGGSSSSVNSLGSGHPATSPLAHVSSHPFAYPTDLGSGRMSSSMMQDRSSPAGIPESEEEDDDEGGRATLTQNTPRKKPTVPVAFTSQEEMPSSPAPFAGADRRKGHHSRTSSGAESVSYARDTDGRWVLERRRTDEDSGTEFIDREYIAATRI